MDDNKVDILIVDDVSDNLALLGQLLQMADFSVAQ